MSVLWAGKPLGDNEEFRLRRVISLLRRMKDDETAENLERFLPENDDRWTPNELETGSHVGPWMLFGAQVEVEDPPDSDPDADQGL
jgi:hypothetical protein